MKNKILFFLSCCCFLYSNTAFCQKENFKEGYIILINGDTLQGKIKELSLRAHAEYVIFKKEHSDHQNKYYPNQLSKYYFKDLNYYESDSIPFKSSSGEIYYQELFLRKLVDGDIELFRLEYKIEESPTPYFDYQSKYYFVRKKREDRLIDLKEDNYKLKLNKLFKTNSCQSSKGNKKFDDEGLTALILEYSNCLGGKSKVVYSKKKRKEISWGISTGFARPEIQFSDRALKDFNIESGRGYDVNVFVLPRINNWISCRIGLNYQYRNQSGALDFTVSEFYDNEGEVLNLKSNATLSHMMIPFHLLLNKSIKNVNFYALSGVYVGTNVRNSFFLDKVKFELIDNESIQFKERVNLGNINLSDAEYGWSIGAGGEFLLKNNQSIFVEVQYSKGENSLAENSGYHMSHQSITFLLGYRFNRFSIDN